MVVVKRNIISKVRIAIEIVKCMSPTGKSVIQKAFLSIMYCLASGSEVEVPCMVLWLIDIAVCHYYLSCIQIKDNLNMCSYMSVDIFI